MQLDQRASARSLVRNPQNMQQQMTMLQFHSVTQHSTNPLQAAVPDLAQSQPAASQLVESVSDEEFFDAID